MDAALLEARLRAFYLRHNAGNQQNIAEIVRKFAGREAELSAKLRRKYGAAPDFSLPEAETREDGADAALYRRDFKPYELKESAGGPLDLRSPDFDPLRALAARDVKLPVPGTFPLDNIQKCRALLPELDPHRQVMQARPKKAPAEADSKRPAASRSTADTAAQRHPTLFEALADTYLDGPFTLLRRCFLEHKRVLVVVRRVNSVRGTCSGLLKAFDKHMNMLLMDVTHEFVPFADHERILREVREGVRSSTSAVLSSSSRSHNRRMGIPARREYHRQLFLRGDNVVSVSYLPPAAPPGRERARARR